MKRRHGPGDGGLPGDPGARPERRRITARGHAGWPDLLARQRAYLEPVMVLVAAEPPDRAALARLRAAIQRRYPNHRFSTFLERAAARGGGGGNGRW